MMTTGISLQVQRTTLMITQSSPIVAKRYPLKIYVMSLDILDIFQHLFLIWKIMMFI